MVQVFFVAWETATVTGSLRPTFPTKVGTLPSNLEIAGPLTQWYEGSMTDALGDISCALRSSAPPRHHQHIG